MNFLTVMLMTGIAGAISPRIGFAFLAVFTLLTLVFG